MAFFLKFLCFSLLLCAPITSVDASCEGTSGGDVLSVWYHKKQNSFILETNMPSGETIGTKDPSLYHDYIIQENNNRIGIADLSRINWPIKEPDGPSINQYSGKGEVGLSISKADDIALIPSALAFQRALIDQKLPRTQIVHPRDMALTFDKIQISIQKIIEEKLGYQKMSSLKSCPYSLRPQHPLTQTPIYRLFFDPTYVGIKQNQDGSQTDLGLLPGPFPGDERSETTVDPKGKCWGFSNDTPLLVGFSWVWECQGSGDLTFAADQLNTKKP